VVRRSSVWCVALVAIAIVAGCGGDGTVDEADAASVVSAPASTPTDDHDGGTFPVTLSHAFGETEIASEPERVVVVGLNEADFLYSLGVAPVGVHEWWGGYPYATGPWADPVREELGAEPAVLQEWEIDVEWVAAQDPDLIVATYHDIDQTMYDLLSEVAPVVAQPAEYENFSTPWREQLRQIAKAVGRVDRAEEVIAGVDELIDQTASDHPSLAGQKFNTGTLAEGDGFTVYSSADVANQSLAELGMAVPAEHDEMADGVYVNISAEQLDVLDLLDVLIILDDTGETEANLVAHPTFTTTRVNQEGRVVIPDFDAMVAMSFNTPLSIPYYLTALAPMLDAAVDGDPTTEQPG
jgi:iron complex transport system substrate-binding protein